MAILAVALRFSRERHALTLSGNPSGNPERATLNRYLQSIGPVKSVPIKPTSQMTRILPTTPHSSPRQPKPRNAYALVASAAANGILIRQGAKIPRQFVYQNVKAIIENGVARDILKADLASLAAASDPRNEAFLLDEHQSKIVINLVGGKILEAQGLL